MPAEARKTVDRVRDPSTEQDGRQNGGPRLETSPREIALEQDPSPWDRVKRWLLVHVRRRAKRMLRRPRSA